jgi:predicted NUDIX family NTP pyrophosphohydrolase
LSDFAKLITQPNLLAGWDGGAPALRAPTDKAEAREADLDAAALKSNTFSLEWPPRSGKTAEFPEVDRAAWFSLDEALEKVSKGQTPIIEALARRLCAKGA